MGNFYNHDCGETTHLIFMTTYFNGGQCNCPSGKDYINRTFITGELINPDNNRTELVVMLAALT